MQLTLNEIRAKSPCHTGWEKLLKSMGKTEADNSRVSIAHLLDYNGINDTLWVIFKCIPDELEKKRNMVADLTDPAIKAAESVLHIFEKKYPNDKGPREAIENAKENIRRSRAGEKRLPTKFYYTYTDAAADAAAAAAAYADAAAAAAAYADAAAAASAYAYADAAADAAAYASADAYAAAARQKSRDNQKQIILKYFGDIN